MCIQIYIHIHVCLHMYVHLSVLLSIDVDQRAEVEGPKHLWLHSVPIALQVSPCLFGFELVFFRQGRPAAAPFALPQGA